MPANKPSAVVSTRRRAMLADQPSPSLRTSLRFVLWAWAFGAVWMYITTGAAQTEYAKLMGLSPFGFGVLGALPFAGALLQVVGSYLIERYGGRKRQFMTAGIIARSIWFFLAAIPWVLPESAWPWAFLIGMTVAMLLLQMTGPAWLGWAADWMPARLRGRYMSRRISLGQWVGLVVTVGVGLGLDYAQQVDPAYLRLAISIGYIIAAICGIADYLMHIPAPNPPDRPTSRPQLLSLLLTPLRDRNFLWFTAYAMTFTFAVGYIGQFAWLYILDEVCRFVPRRFLVANVMLVAVPILVSILVYPFWGRFIDRFGRKPALVLGTLLIINGASAWVFVRPENWWFGYMAVVFGVCGWPAIHLATFNILLAMSETRGGRKGSSAYVAIHAVAVAIAGTLSGLFGGSIAQWLGPEFRASLFGWPVTYHGVLFIISAGLRLFALVLLIPLHDPAGRYTTRAAVQYMLGGLYSNLQQGVFSSSRMLSAAGRASRLIYKLNPLNRPRNRSH